MTSGKEGSASWRPETFTDYGDVVADEPLTAPVGELRAGAIQDREPERKDQTGVFGDGDELGRGDELAALRPARQRLEALNRAMGQVDNRLIRDREPPLLDHAGGARFPPEAGPRPCCACSMSKHRDGILRMRLRRVHRDISVSHQLGCF